MTILFCIYWTCCQDRCRSPLWNEVYGHLGNVCNHGADRPGINSNPPILLIHKIFFSSICCSLKLGGGQEMHSFIWLCNSLE